MHTGMRARYPAQSIVSLLAAPRVTQAGLYLTRADGGQDLQKVIVAAFDRYCVSNPLHPDVFPAVRKMEAEVVAMVLKMYNNPGGAGCTTSGGTESIVMAVKTYRDWARATKGITEPEMYVATLGLLLIHHLTSERGRSLELSRSLRTPRSTRAQRTWASRCTQSRSTQRHARWTSSASSVPSTLTPLWSVSYDHIVGAVC